MAVGLRPSFACLGTGELRGECGSHSWPHPPRAAWLTAGLERGRSKRELMEIVLPKIISINLFFIASLC